MESESIRLFLLSNFPNEMFFIKDFLANIETGKMLPRGDKLIIPQGRIQDFEKGGGGG